MMWRHANRLGTKTLVSAALYVAARHIAVVALEAEVKRDCHPSVLLNAADSILRPRALMPRAAILAQSVSCYDRSQNSDLLDGTVVVEIFLVIARRSVSLSRINIILAGFFDNALRRLVPIRVVVETRSDIAAERGLLFFKLGVATKR
jgi:hypothetical protein